MIDRMRKFDIFCIRLHDLQIAFHGIGLYDEMIDRFEGIIRKGSITKTLFMWNNIIGNKNHFALLPFFPKEFLCNTGYHSVSRGEERQPEFEDDHIRLEIRNHFPRFTPGNRINRVDNLN